MVFRLLPAGYILIVFEALHINWAIYYKFEWHVQVNVLSTLWNYVELCGIMSNSVELGRTLWN